MEIIIGNLILALASAFGIWLGHLWDTKVTQRHNWRGWYIDD